MLIKILIADDHAVVREGLRLILEAEGDISVIGEADNGKLAVQQIQKLVPDVVVMDISMPILNGIEATEQIMNAKIPTRIIILSMHSSKEHILHALEVGAQGYLLKESAGKELIKAVRMVYAGHRFLSDSILRTINDGEIHQRKADSKENPIKTKKTYHNMQRLKLKPEKRRHVRFKAPENLFAALGNPVQKVGKVKDISMGGLAFEYIPGEKEDGSASHVDIFLSGNGFYLSKVPCREVYDFIQPAPSISGHVFSDINMNRCGIWFENLTEEINRQLVYFFGKHTTEMVL